MSLLLQIQVASTLFVVWASYALVRWFFQSSTLDNVRGPPPDSLVFGSLRKLLSIRGWDYHRHLAENYPGVAKIKALFGADALFVNDPKALYHILVKDQNIYEETELFIASNRMMFGEGIFTSIGDPHRKQRKMLNPVFSISHMRSMVPIFYDIAHKVQNTLTQMAKDGPKEVDVMEWMTRTALELIGQTGLGFSFDTLEEGSQPHAYGIASKQLLPLSAQDAVLSSALLPIISKIGTAKFRRFVVDHIPSPEIKHLRDIVDTLHNTSVEIYESKKKALQEGDEVLAQQIGRGKDIISILMKANIDASEEDKLSEEELLGQITSLTFAATDTTSTALSRTLHLLSLHKDVQDKLRAELREARNNHDGQDLPYDTLVNELPYLDAICRETLRLYPPVPSVLRSARQDMILPLSTPIQGTDGTMLSSLAVPKGTDIHISILTSNRNKQVWGGDAYEWRPERWLKPLPESVVKAHMPGVYSHLLTFIGGGRSCIGFKFSQLEMKVVLALLVDTLEFSKGEKEIVWQMTGVVTPNVDPDSAIPTMPLVIGRAK